MTLMFFRRIESELPKFEEEKRDLVVMFLAALDDAITSKQRMQTPLFVLVLS
jgi:hypothetical protein